MKYSIIVTGWNCQQYVQKCLQSFIDQSVKDFEVIVVDDGSTDDTFTECVKFVGSLMNQPGDKHWTVNQLIQNQGTYYARDFAIQKARGEVIVMVDFDDHLLPHALAEVEKAYEDSNILMTYGNYQYSNGKVCPVNLHYSDEVHAARSYREDGTWRCTHLRTFRRDLYNRIPKWKLTQSEERSYPDVEVLFSMLEMAGKDRMAVIDRPLYVYNTDNPHFTLKRFGKDHAGYYEICKRPKRELL